ncbi:hypothetical protein AAIB33_17335 [Microbacterium sp. AZCO]|uniref:TolB family protein n=1 Tax=Microbacterium sp. AZCO TaxID=3142976 RepID=UPI0031F40D29
MSTRRARWIAVVAISITALAVVGATAAIALQRNAARAGETVTAASASPAPGWATGDRIVFRSTAPGADYGLVASVPLDDPQGPRATSGVACDRVDASAHEFACLWSERGIVPAYRAALYEDSGRPMQEWSLPGVPSRTRLSDDASLVATTSFVTGHSYAAVGFSTQTVVRRTSGEVIGDLEQFTLLIGGQPTAPVDRNFWGVTFADDTTFYATAQTGGQTYLVEGDLKARTLTAIAKNVECPSLSPDGSRIAFKRVESGSGPTVHWTPSILDLATKQVRTLPESRSVDDQIEWLDDSTILYGMPRATGDSDVWALRADGSQPPELFLEHAWSPSVVRSS